MSELIRSWPDSLYYFSSISTANVREQFSKQQVAAKLVKVLSDASTVNTNGDVLQDILTGLSFGNSTQRHKYRALYDTTNDRFVIQRNSGTDASKTWVELFRISSSGAITTTGAVTAAGGLTTTGAGITMGGNLDMNQFYLLNVEKINGRTRTDSLIVHDATRLFGDVNLYRNAMVAQNFYVAGTSDLKGATSVQGAQVFSYTYATNSANQDISALTETNITSLSGLTLPNTSNVTSRKFMIRFSVAVRDTSAINNAYSIRIYSGSTGTLSDTLRYLVPNISLASRDSTLSGLYRLIPVSSTATKFGLAIASEQTCRILGALETSTVECWEVV